MTGRLRPASLLVPALLVSALLAAPSGAQAPAATPPAKPAPEKKGKPKKQARPEVTIETARGNIVVELFPDKAPATVDNFITLVKRGFYDGLTFHRVEDGIVQGGDPKGDGTGGPGYTIRDEKNDLLNVRGAVGMAKGGPDTAGSQFYIVTAKAIPALDAGGYTLFGRIVSGQDVPEKIIRGDKMTKVTVAEPAGYKFGPTRGAEPELTFPAQVPSEPGGKPYRSVVRVRVEILPDGKTKAELKRKSGNAAVDAAVLDAVRSWTWKPALKNGDPVKSVQEFDYDIPTGSRTYN